MDSKHKKMWLLLKFRVKVRMCMSPMTNRIQRGEEMVRDDITEARFTRDPRECNLAGVAQLAGLVVTLHLVRRESVAAFEERWRQLCIDVRIIMSSPRKATV